MFFNTDFDFDSSRAPTGAGLLGIIATCGGLRSGGLVPVQRARCDRGRVGALACVLKGKAKARSGVRRSGAVGEDVCGTLKPLPKEKVGATVAAEAEQRRVRVRCGGGTRVGAPGEARLQSASSRPSAGCAPPWQPAPWSRRSRTPRATPDTLTRISRGGAEERWASARALLPSATDSTITSSAASGEGKGG